MAKITRYNGNLQAFGINAVGDERSVFGDFSTQSNDITDNVTTEYLRGWGNIPTGGKPTKQDFNGVLFAATQMLSYLHQMGTPEYNAAQEYHVGSRCVGSDGRPYRSLTSPNVGNDPVSDGGANWINDTDGLQANIDAEESARISADSTHAALTNPHSATSSATASRLCLRDSGGRVGLSAATSSINPPIMSQFGINIGASHGRIIIPGYDGSTVRPVTIQWKEIALPNNSSVAHTFSYAFANKCFGVFICRSSNLDNYSEESGVAYFNLTTTGCSIGSSMATNAMIYAIGY